jgi:hypothetical protein
MRFLVSCFAICVLPVAGCRFDVTGLDKGASVLPDLAMATPSGRDGSPSDPPDMARMRDAAALPDMAETCVTISEPFDTSTWVLAGAASLDSQQQMQLTTTEHNRAGSAFLSRSLYTPGFDANFHFRMWDGSGADGLAFVFAKAPNAAALGVYGDKQVNLAWSLGYLHMNGFAVELDTYQNDNNNDPNDNHVGFMVTSTGKHLLAGTPAVSLRNDAGHDAHVRFDGTHVRVDIDGSAVIDADVPADPDSAPFAPDQYWFGFSGASGGLNDHHTVSDLTLVVGPNDCL